MESLVNYQTLISDLTGMPIAQASLLVSFLPSVMLADALETTAHTFGHAPHYLD